MAEHDRTVLNTLESIPRRGLDIDDSATQRLRQQLMDAARASWDADASTAPTAVPEPKGTASRPPEDPQTERDIVARMGRKELEALIEAQRTSPEATRAVLADARTRIEGEVQSQPVRSHTALADRFNVKRHLTYTDYEFRNRPGEAAFTERWLKLQTRSDSGAVAQAMIDRAQERGWNALLVQGSGEFKRQAWIAGEARGIKVSGHEPTQTDRAAARAEYARLHPGVVRTVGSEEPAQTRGAPVQDQADQPRRNAERMKEPQPQQSGPVSTVDSRRHQNQDVLEALDKAMASKRLPIAQREQLRSQVEQVIASFAQQGRTVRAKRPASQRQYVGELVEHGPARFNFDAHEAPNYYATLRSANGKQVTVWGLGLGAALSNARVEIGEQVQLEVTGRKEVSVEANVRDKQGAVVGQKIIDTERNAWKATVMGPTRVPERARPQFAR
jgi:Large polyvalent protein-associated domain 7